MVLQFCLCRRRVRAAMETSNRALNKVTVKNQFPLPRINDLFDELHGDQYLTSLAASGFHQTLLREEDCPKTAFRTLLGHCYLLPIQSTCQPASLTKSTTKFQSVMHRKFNPPQHNADGPNNLDHPLTEFVLVLHRRCTGIQHNCQ